MKEQSKQQALDLIIDTLDKADIDMLDKVELMLNIRQFIMGYDENVKILRRIK